MDPQNLLREENYGNKELSITTFAQSQSTSAGSEDSVRSSTRTDISFKDQLTKRLRQLKVFPLFGDEELSRISVNYWLYLEFFHSAIQLLGKVFAVAVIVYLLQTYVLKVTITSIGSKFYYLYVIIMGILLVFFRLRGESKLIKDKLVFQFQWTEDLFCLLIEDIPNNTSSDELVAYFNSLLPLRITGGYVRNIILVKDYYDYTSILKRLEQLNKKLEEDKEMNDSPRIKVENLKQKLITEISAEENRLKVSSGHHGKAIVTFNLLRTEYIRIEIWILGRLRFDLINYEFGRNRFQVQNWKVSSKIFCWKTHYFFFLVFLKIYVIFFLPSNFGKEFQGQNF